MTVAVVGGGVSGMSAACSLAEAGYGVRLIERRPYLGGRAVSYFHPGVGETIDNCQHVLFGCCTELRAFYRRIGADGLIRWSDTMTLIEPGGRRSVLGPSPLPAPLHGLPRLLAAPAFSRADKFALCRAFLKLLRPIPADSNETLGAWLARHRQTPGALERFWRLVIASALNADLDSIGVAYAAKVIRELFLQSAEAGRMGVATVPLGQLYQGVPAYLQARQSEVLFNTRIEMAAWDGERRKWKLFSTAGPLESDLLVLALPFEAMARLLPQMPSEPGVERLAAQLSRHEHWPICSVHLWYDREITVLPHAALLDGQIHWLFNKTGTKVERVVASAEAIPSGLALRASHLRAAALRVPNALASSPKPLPPTAAYYIELVVSADRKFAALSGEEAIAQATAALPRYFPEAASARLLKSAFVKELRATFGVPPGIDAARPSALSPWPNCYLAGDWTATGWPSTMESAARAGQNAAKALQNVEAASSPLSLPG
jgi:squalene-associated FAD-dependent desaturase